MMKLGSVCCICLLFLSFAVAVAVAQQPAEDSSRPPSMSAEELATKASQTPKGRSLHFELLRLEKMRAGLGKKHPSLSTLDTTVSQLRAELVDWIRKSESEQDGSSGAKYSGESGSRGSSGTEAPPEMANTELLRVIAALVTRIERLERRVQQLEARR